MGRADKRRSLKMRRRNAQRKKKDRIKRRIEAAKGSSKKSK